MHKKEQKDYYSKDNRIQWFLRKYYRKCQGLRRLKKGLSLIDSTVEWVYESNQNFLELTLTSFKSPTSGLLKSLLASTYCQFSGTGYF